MGLESERSEALLLPGRPAVGLHAIRLSRAYRGPVSQTPDIGLLGPGCKRHVEGDCHKYQQAEIAIGAEAG